MSQVTTTLQPRADVTILAERCKACELCVVTCPQGNLKLSTKLNHAGFHPAEFSYRGLKGECTGCAICYWVCPDFAISEIQVKG
ncbi:MAG: 4Fe-4S binding protein [Candidatus Bathyarchaeia archaeon]